MKAEIHHDMSNADYHADTSAVSKSGLDLIHQCPAMYKAMLDGSLERNETPAMAAGTLAHTAILEPTELEKRYTACDLNRNTKAFKELAAANPDTIFIKTVQMLAAITMREAVLAHPSARDALTLGDGFAEASVFWTDETTGLRCKCRPDYYNESAGIVVDLKTTTSADPHAFAKSVWNYRYHVQAAFYLDGCRAAGLEAKRFLFIAVEKTSPYLVSVLELDAMDVDLGRQHYQRDLATLADCKESGHWPGYGDDVLPITLPTWAYNDDEALEVA